MCRFQADNQEETAIIAVVVLCLLAMLAPLAGCDQARTNFDKITFGMSRADVERLIGKPAQVEERAKPVAYWIYGDKQLVVQYNNDKVQVKQVGPVVAAAPAKKK